MKRVLFVVAVFVLLVGCEMPDVNVTGLNVQRSAIHGSGQVGVAAILDNRPTVEVPNDIKAIKETVKEIRKFLETGNVADLTMGEFRKALDKLIPEKYQPYFNAILAAVSNIHVDTQKVGKDNLKRIKAALNGIEYRADNYDLEDHPPMTDSQERGFGLPEVPSVDVEYKIDDGSLLKRKVGRGN